MTGAFKYVVAAIVILVLLVVLQRGCKGPFQRWRENRQERQDRWEEINKERRESWREWWKERRDNRKAD